MKFRTEFIPVRSEITLRPELPLLTIGSCFADNISARMRSSMWDAENPLGVQYNPWAMLKILQLSIFPDNTDASFQTTLFEANGLTHSWLLDSSGSAPTRSEAIAKFVQRRRRLTDMLAASQVLFVTFGTLNCFLLKDRTVVANCHKQPQALFSRERLSIDESVRLWDGFITDLRMRYPLLKVVFTVSPVRHVRDGLTENWLSKAGLRVMIEEICHRQDCCSYFPAYEILNDDLRDYRFYASDLVHPSDQAVEYIWEIFKQTYLDEAGLEYLREGEALMRRAGHRPILMSPGQYADYRLETDRLIAEFKARHSR